MFFHHLEPSTTSPYNNLIAPTTTTKMCNYHHTIFSCGCTEHTHTQKCELERYRDIAIARSADSLNPAERRAFVDLQTLAEKLRPSYRMHGYEEVYYAKDKLCSDCQKKGQEEGTEEMIRKGEVVKWRKGEPTQGWKVGYEENYNKDGSLKHEIKRNLSVDMLRPRSRAEMMQTGRSVSYPSKKPSPLDQKNLLQPSRDGGMGGEAPRLREEESPTAGERTMSMTESAIKAVKKVRFGFMEMPEKPMKGTSEFRKTPKR